MERTKLTRIKDTITQNWRLYILMIPGLLWLIVFAYYPMYGVIIAFKNYKGKMGINGSPWAEPILKHFSAFFSTSIASTAISNTLMLSLLTILISFPVPIVFALLLNQIKKKQSRKVIQTISYAPYFISNVVVVSIMTVILAPSGFVNTIVGFFGHRLYRGIGGDQPGLLRSSHHGRGFQIQAHPPYRYAVDRSDDHHHVHPGNRQCHDHRL